MKNNIVSFPSDKIVRGDMFDTDQVKIAKKKGTQNYADTIIEEIMDAIAVIANEYGIDDNEHFLNDTDFASAVITAAVYHAFDIEHPLQQYLSECRKIVEKELNEDNED